MHVYDLKPSNYRLFNIQKQNVYINGRIKRHIPLNLVRTSYILRKSCYFEYSNLVEGLSVLFELDSSPSPVFYKILLFLDVIFLFV